MLFPFRVPRTRPWEGYIKKLCTQLEKNDKTAHISQFFQKAAEHRQQLVPILDDCAKNHHTRPEDIIKVLESYLPLLANICDSIKTNVVELKGTLDIVWTSFLTIDVNSKSLSHSIQWEKCCAYLTLGLAHYQLATKIHHENRQESAKKKKEEKTPSYDPIFDEPIEKKDPKIFDDTEKIKEISQHLKKAAAIWNYCAEKLYPIEVTKEFQVIPEVFRDMAAVLSSLALVNAQEFMVQLAVQTDKSSAITAKLAQGVADKLESLHKQIDSSLGSTHADSVSSDFRYYLRIRASLYKAIALKYQGKFAREKKLWGDCVTYFKTAKATLKGIEFPKKKTEMNPYLEGLNASVQRQLGSINVLTESAQKDNDAIYHELERPIEQLDRVEGLFKMQPEEYKGYDT